jgi:hypothetical protein
MQFFGLKKKLYHSLNGKRVTSNKKFNRGGLPTTNPTKKKEKTGPNL